MRPIRFRDDESSTGTTIATVLLGAVAGFAVGMYVAQRVGGFSGLSSRLKRGLKTAGDSASRTFDFAGDAFDEIEEEVDVPATGASVADDEDEDFDIPERIDESESEAAPAAID